MRLSFTSRDCAWRASRFRSPVPMLRIAKWRLPKRKGCIAAEAARVLVAFVAQRAAVRVPR